MSNIPSDDDVGKCYSRPESARNVCFIHFDSKGFFDLLAREEGKKIPSTGIPSVCEYVAPDKVAVLHPPPSVLCASTPQESDTRGSKGMST